MIPKSLKTLAWLGAGAYVTTQLARSTYSYTFPSVFGKRTGLDFGDPYSNMTANTAIMNSFAYSAMSPVSAAKEVLSTPWVRNSVLLGSTAGGLLGAVLGATREARGLKRGFRAAASGAFRSGFLGAAAGTVAAVSLASSFVSAVGNFSQGFLSKIAGIQRKPLQPRGKGNGPGFRSWAKFPGSRMPVGHLGATGDLVFAMNKIRNKSMLR